MRYIVIAEYKYIDSFVGLNIRYYTHIDYASYIHGIAGYITKETFKAVFVWLLLRVRAIISVSGQTKYALYKVHVFVERVIMCIVVYKLPRSPHAIVAFAHLLMQLLQMTVRMMVESAGGKMMQMMLLQLLVMMVQLLQLMTGVLLLLLLVMVQLLLVQHRTRTASGLVQYVLIILVLFVHGGCRFLL